MRLFRKIENCPPDIKHGVVTLGNFDGLHKGHQALISKAKAIAKEQNLPFSVITFEPHPTIIINNNKNIRILPLRDKLEHFKQLGVENLFIIKFNRSFANINANEFIEKILITGLAIKHIVIGYDFNIGQGKSGNIDLLNKYSSYFNITQLTAFKEQDIICSSSNIRKFLSDGNMYNVNQLLGYNYNIKGIVVDGKKLASKLGYPTINVKLKNLSRPRFGVYLVRLFIENDNKTYYGMANLGVRPTVNGGKELLEVNIFDFNKNIYGAKVKVELIEFIRDEIKFSSIEELKQQIHQDEILIKKMVCENV